MFSLTTCLYIATFLFSAGVYGVLGRRNILVVLMSLELMLNGINLALVAGGRVYAFANPETAHTGQIFALMVIAVAAAEAAVGLAILLLIWRRMQTIDVRDICRLHS